jgi:hypothetical protein
MTRIVKRGGTKMEGGVKEEGEEERERGWEAVEGSGCDS